MRRGVYVSLDMIHVVGNESLETICFGDQPAQLLLVRRGRFGLDGSGLAETIPIAFSEGLLDAGEQLGDRLESDGYSPDSAAMWAQASRRSVRLFETNGNEVASLLTFA